MTRAPATVVINAAGRGTRLGLDRSKALVEVAGRPLIEWQLRMLEAVPDVRVVVGYQGDEVAATARALRPGIRVLTNTAYRTTKSAASLMVGAAGCPGFAVSLDADLIVHPDDLAPFIAAEDTRIGVVATQSVEPISVHVDRGGVATAFEPCGSTAGICEWSGLVAFDPREPGLGPRDGHVYELIAPLLPLPTTMIRARELDYQSELPQLVTFVEDLVRAGAL